MVLPIAVQFGLAHPPCFSEKKTNSRKIPSTAWNSRETTTLNVSRETFKATKQVTKTKVNGGIITYGQPPFVYNILPIFSRKIGVRSRSKKSLEIGCTRGKEISRMGKGFAFTNEKGGVGKTTIAVKLGSYLAFLGKKVFVLDNDP